METGEGCTACRFMLRLFAVRDLLFACLINPSSIIK